MSHPYVSIDLAKIADNARTVTGLCRDHGIEVTGVTKATQGDPKVARAMLAGGVSSIGESRIEHIRRLKESEIDAPFMLLTVPAPSDAADVVAAADVSLNSELATLGALSEAARAVGRVHDVVIMVDLGDLREGVLPDDLEGLARNVLDLPGTRLKGIGANLTCFGGVVPSADNMGRLAALAERVEAACGADLEWVSGANSSGLKLIASGAMPARINHARIGEAILLGRETTHHDPWPGTRQDAFLLHAEVVEVKEKPSVPLGEVGEDAFGHVPSFEDRGERTRAILNIGREDVEIEGLTPVADGLTVLGGSSDYVIVEVAPDGTVALGETLTFTLNYAALVAVMASRYVEKRYSGQEGGG
jgi:predicted amino acid racemase